MSVVGSFEEAFEKAPVRLKIVSFLLFVIGLFSVVLAVIAIVTKSNFYGKLTTVMFVEGVLYMALAFGLIKRETFAFYATVVLGSFWVILSIMHHAWIAAIINGLILAAVVTCRNWFFNKTAPSTTTTTTATPAPATIKSIERGKYFGKRRI